VKSILQLMVLVFLLAGFLTAGSQSVTTAAIDESFEGSFPPSGWTLLSDLPQAENWKQSSAKSRTGSNSALGTPNYFYDRNIWLVSPVIDLSSATKATLYFYEDQEGWSSINNTSANAIAISTTNNTSSSSFTDILTMTPANHTISGFSGEMVTVDLSAYLGQSTVYVAFHYYCHTSPSYNWYIDDVRISIPSDHDVWALGVNMNDHYDAYSTATPSGIVKNEGLNTESFDVHFGYYDLDGAKIYVSQSSVSNLAPGMQTEVTFPEYTFGSNRLNYFIETALTGDMDASNNEATKYIDSYAYAQSIVLFEQFTGTWCQWCPGVANTLDDLHHNYPGEVAIIAYHNDDDFSNSYGGEREDFYGISGFPTVWINGTIERSGGAQAGDDYSHIYNDYEGVFLEECERYTPIGLDLAYYEDSPNLRVISTITFGSETTSLDDRIYYALCESHIAYNWQTSMDSLHFVEREMYPDANGTDVYPGTSNPPIGYEFKDTVDFTIPAGTVKENCEFIAFIQDPNTHEVKNSKIIDLRDPIISSISDKNKFKNPQSFSLSQNYPNPFNPTTTINFTVVNTGNVEISLYNALGEKIKTVLNETKKSGEHQLIIDGTDLTSGVYFYQMKSGNFSQTKKMLLLK